MNNYEVLIEHINPCGGRKHAIREIIEVDAESPLAYVQANMRYPVIEEFKEDGNVVIVTGNECGYMDRYTFSE